MSSGTGLLALERLYGREREQSLIRDLLDTDEAGTLILVGEGGIGKTRLLEWALDLLQAQGRRPPQLLDFYHVEQFKASEIEKALIRAVRQISPKTPAFELYEEQRRRLETARQSGEAFQLALERLREQFVHCFNDAAAECARAGRRVAVVFDTLEQAAPLHDPVERTMRGPGRSASDGGAYWLRSILPRLRDAQFLLSGRPSTLGGDPVKLYGQLQAASAAVRVHDVLPLDRRQSAEFLEALRGRYMASDDPAVRRQAELVPDDAVWVELCAEVAEGQPFWLTMIFTCAYLAVVPREIDREYFARKGEQPVDDDAFGDAPPPELEPREALIRELLERFDINVDDILLALHWMAIARKGVSPAILRAIADRERPTMDVDAVFRGLQELMVVKRRSFSADAEGAGEPADAVRLFLHDEMYRQLDRNRRNPARLRRPVSEVLLSWHDNELREVRDERQRRVEERLDLPDGAADAGSAAVDAQIAQAIAQRRGRQARPERQSPPTSADDYARLSRQIDESTRRERQIILDRLGYCYQLSRELGRFEYNLRIYAATVDREYGFAVTLRQEALRNLDRLGEALSSDEEAEYAALLVMHTIAAEDSRTAVKLVPILESYQSRGQSPIVDALIALALGQVALETGQQREQVEAHFLRAAASAADTTAADPDMGRWRAVLRSQILYYHGLHHRRIFELSSAVEAYRAALRLALAHPEEGRGLYARIYNTLGYALSEQGFVRDGHFFAHEGLRLNQRYSTAYFEGLSYNTLARILLRDGQPLLARRYALRAWRIFEALDTDQGRSLCLPVLANTYRKEAEKLDDNPVAQGKAYAAAKECYTLHYLVLREIEIPPPDRWIEMRRGLGCTHRSHGLALLRRQDERIADPSGMREARREFRRASFWLNGARTASGSWLPPLLRLDLMEDIAELQVNQNLFDERIEQYLREGESVLASNVLSTYLIQPGVGVREVERPVRAFWRELGQCQIQRMMAGFGAYEYGFAHYDPATRTRTPLRRHDPADLMAAARAMVLAFAYLIQYDRGSATLLQAVELAARELRRDLSEQQISVMLEAAFQTASEFELLDSSALALAEQQMTQALDDIGLRVITTQSKKEAV